MANSKQIVYLSQAQYAELIANGTITVDGVTVTYDENDIYVTPQAEPVTDVRINGTSIAANGVANIPMAGDNTLGLVRVRSSTSFGVKIDSAGNLDVRSATSAQTKAGTATYIPITPYNQHESAFYAIAKVAGHDEKDSTNAVGTYTPEAKGAIQQMLGVSDLIATSENDLVASKAYKVGDVFTANGKLYKATAAIAADGAIIPAVEGEEIEGANCTETNIGESFIKNTDYASETSNGVVRVKDSYGVGTILSYNINTGATERYTGIISASSDKIKNGAELYNPIIPYRQHESVFYGLAKAAGDTTQKASENAVGNYTDEAKSAIRTMLGAVGSEDYATSSTAGLVKIDTSYGLNIYSNGILRIWGAGDAELKNGTNQNKPITPEKQHIAAFYGLAKAAGDTTQSASSNAIGQYTDDAAAAIRSMIGAENGDDIVKVQDTEPTTSATKIWLPETPPASVTVPTVAEMESAIQDASVDVQINGASIVSEGVANIPVATQTSFGVTKGYGSSGINIDASGNVSLAVADAAKVKAGTSNGSAIPPSKQHEATFYGLAKAAGDTTQSASSNAVGTYTDDAKLAIQTMLGIDLSSIASQVEIPLVETVSGSAVTISGQPNTRYMCGEVTSISITPPASGSIDVVFTSGSTVAVLTLPSTVKMPEWFDASTLDTDTVYEILITDGVYGSVMTWQA